MRNFDHGPGLRYQDGWFEHPLLAMLAFVVLVAALVAFGVWLFNRTRRAGIDDPLRHAAARYADGKIGRVEFERIQADLAAAGIARPAVGATPPTADEAPPGREDAPPPSDG